METRRVGTSGLRASRLGLGTLTWARDTTEEQARGLLQAFVEAGGTLLDTAAEPRRQRGALVRAHYVEVEVDGVDARERRDVLLHLILEARAQRAAGDGQSDRHLDPAAVELDAAHHLELGHRAAQLGIDHIPERGQDLVAARHHGEGTGWKRSPEVSFG